MKMNTKTRNEYIRELITIINKYVYENDLFAGGCCYSAYLLASALKMAKIKYDIMMFQYLDILNVNNFNDAINGNGVSHVAVTVRYNRKKITIGSCQGIYQYFKATCYKYKVWTYKNVNPDDILDGYKHGNWNRYWDTRLNKILAYEIENVVKKYVGDIKLDKVDLYKNERDSFEMITSIVKDGWYCVQEVLNGFFKI